MPNPYASTRTDAEIGLPRAAQQQYSAYAVPTGNAPYSGFGWSPTLNPSPTDIPSGQRIGTIPRYDYRPDPARPSDASGLYDRQDIDDKQRHSVEDQNAVGWTENKAAPGYPSPTAGLNRFAPNPRSIPSPEPRLTQQLSPRTYSFTRPFDQFNRTYDGGPPTGSARTFNGMHFSMANHKRAGIGNQILTMQPPQSRRNTYRLDPVPWDVNIVDMPPEGSNTPTPGKVTSMELPYQPRSYRLD